jgi:hypothetical protein
MLWDGRYRPQLEDTEYYAGYEPISKTGVLDVIARGLTEHGAVVGNVWREATGNVGNALQALVGHPTDPIVTSNAPSKRVDSVPSDASFRPRAISLPSTPQPSTPKPLPPPRNNSLTDNALQEHQRLQAEQQRLAAEQRQKVISGRADRKVEKKATKARAFNPSQASSSIRSNTPSFPTSQSQASSSNRRPSRANSSNAQSHANHPPQAFFPHQPPPSPAHAYSPPQSHASHPIQQQHTPDYSSHLGDPLYR